MSRKKLTSLSQSLKRLYTMALWWDWKTIITISINWLASRVRVKLKKYQQIWIRTVPSASGRGRSASKAAFATCGLEITTRGRNNTVPSIASPQGTWLISKPFKPIGMDMAHFRRVWILGELQSNKFSGRKRWGKQFLVVAFVAYHKLESHMYGPCMGHV